MPVQAETYWWCAREVSQQPVGKKLLLMNMDETSIAHTFGSPSGLVVRQAHECPVAPCKKAELRGATTSIPLICNDLGIQPKLPHFILGNGNDRKFAQALMTELKPLIPDNVYLWAAKSAWNNVACVGRILGVLAKCLAPWHESHKFVLVLDVASMHINPSVIGQARRLGVNLLFVPAEVTHLQHPLDTHGFALLKAWLRASYQELRQLSEDGEVTLSAWAKLFMQAPRNVFAKRRWESALTATGVLPGSVPLTRKLQGLVGSTMPSSCRTDQPTDADLKYIWPKRCRLEGFAHLLFGEVAESLPRI